jgi:DNA repair exonuclease SbcCD ATPase subunit
MMAKLNIDKVYLRNFRSYGDYDTELKLDGLGHALILGEVESNKDNKSNGSGKSTISEAILWCLFGRLSSKDKPADHVVNKTVGHNCMVTITTVDGYRITRTRKMDAHNELLIVDPNGEDISQSTTKQAQVQLNKLFDLDYHIFTSSVFFAQFGMSFLELTDQKRKKTLEKLIHLDRFDYYVEVCKEKIQELALNLAKYDTVIASYDNEINRIINQIEETKQNKTEYEEERQTRITTQKRNITLLCEQIKTNTISIQGKISLAKKELEQIKTYDLNATRKQWEAYEEKIKKQNSKLEKYKIVFHEAEKLQAIKESLEQSKPTNGHTEKIQRWKEQLEVSLKEYNTLEEPDLANIEKQWEKENQKQEKINKIRKNVEELNIKIAKQQSLIESKENSIRLLKSKEGQICHSCYQKISKNYVDKNNEQLISEINEMTTIVEGYNTEIDTLNKHISQLENLPIPIITIDNAKNAIRTKERKKLELQLLKKAVLDAVEDKKKSESKIIEIDKKVMIINEDIQKKRSKAQDGIEEVRKAILDLDNEKPSISIDKAESQKIEFDLKDKEINRLQESMNNLDIDKDVREKEINEEIIRIKNESNPHDKILTTLDKTVSEIKEKQSNSKLEIADLNNRSKHLEYIRSAYSDRRKIKSFLLSKIIPYFNERIRYYLNSFDCSYFIEFTDAIQIKSEQWPYELWSGGERKRIDLAIMFAIHDMHTSLYDQQCNVLVFDEVDGRLDNDGIQRFVEVLFNEFSSDKVNNLVISHKDVMVDSFPTKIIIRKGNDGFSRISEIR